MRALAPFALAVAVATPGTAQVLAPLDGVWQATDAIVRAGSDCPDHMVRAAPYMEKQLARIPSRPVAWQGRFDASGAQQLDDEIVEGSWSLISPEVLKVERMSNGASIETGRLRLEAPDKLTYETQIVAKAIFADMDQPPEGIEACVITTRFTWRLQIIS